MILPGATYLVTRRCSERRFFLRPSETMNALFAYVLAVVAERYGILLHAFCVMSNHFHIVLTDPDARLPDFHRDLESLVARAGNVSIGHWESFWDPESYSAVRLETVDAIFEKIVYVLANPVQAGLVRWGCEWPGLWSDPASIGGPPVTIERPKGFFRENGPMPASATLELHRPPGFDDDASIVEALRAALHEAEERAASEHASFLGRRRVLAQTPHARPAVEERHRDLTPRVACRDRWKRLEALLRLAEFGRAYHAALTKWKAGVRDVVFPPGTWLMRVQHAVACAAPG